jgi:hypothetical protein
MSDVKIKSCLECKWHVSEDFGYSNYTTEGTTFHCALRKHPDGEFDQFYGEEKRLKYAAECQSFEAGEGVDMDCDHENEADLTPEAREVWELHQRS